MKFIILFVKKGLNIRGFKTLARLIILRWLKPAMTKPSLFGHNFSLCPIDLKLRFPDNGYQNSLLSDTFTLLLPDIVTCCFPDFIFVVLTELSLLCQPIWSFYSFDVFYGFIYWYTNFRKWINKRIMFINLCFSSFFSGDNVRLF